MNIVISSLVFPTQWREYTDFSQQVRLELDSHSQEGQLRLKYAPEDGAAHQFASVVVPCLPRSILTPRQVRYLRVNPVTQSPGVPTPYLVILRGLSEDPQTTHLKESVSISVQLWKRENERSAFRQCGEFQEIEFFIGFTLTNSWLTSADGDRLIDPDTWDVKEVF